MTHSVAKRHVDTDVTLRYACSYVVLPVRVRTSVMRLKKFMFSVARVSDHPLAVWVVCWCGSVTPSSPYLFRGVIGVQVGKNLCP